MQTTGNSIGVPIVTVSQVNRVVGMLIKGDKRLGSVAVRGEISNFTRHYKTGHLYFTLKDEQTQLKAVMFVGNAQTLDFSPQNGDKVICRGAITVYEPTGVYQINCVSMQQDGAGEQAAALEELKKRLSEQGVFSQKRQLPPFPKKIAVITALGGAALQDIINVISRRYPVAGIIVIPALVQGAGAAQSVAGCLARAQSTDADVIIFGRGGGSAEDLSAFNTETVARAVFASRIPTISAVGHETDFTIADMAADMRAPTPSAAAELAVPEIGTIAVAIDGAAKRAASQIRRCICANEDALSARAETVRALSPQGRIALWNKQLDSLCAEIPQKMHGKISAAEKALSACAEVISALNPLAVLSRGYSAVSRDGAIISDSAQLSVGDRIDIRFGSGSAAAEITSVKRD